MVGLEKLKYVNQIKHGAAYLEGEKYEKVNHEIQQIFTASSCEQDWNPVLLNETKNFFMQTLPQITPSLSNDEVLEIISRVYIDFREIDRENIVYILLLLMMVEDIWTLYFASKQDEEEKKYEVS